MCSNYKRLFYITLLPLTHMQRFLEACSLANLMQFSSESSPVGQSFVKITVTKDDCQVTGGGQFAAHNCCIVSLTGVAVHIIHLSSSRYICVHVQYTFAVNV